MEKEVARVTQTSEVNIRTTMEPGDVGYVIYLHGVLYAREYGLDQTFEGGVAERFGEFAKQYDPRKDFFAVAELDGRIVGSIVIHGLADNTAHAAVLSVAPRRSRSWSRP